MWIVVLFEQKHKSILHCLLHVQNKGGKITSVLNEMNVRNITEGAVLLIVVKEEEVHHSGRLDILSHLTYLCNDLTICAICWWWTQIKVPFIELSLMTRHNNKLCTCWCWHQTWCICVLCMCMNLSMCVCVYMMQSLIVR